MFLKNFKQCPICHPSSKGIEKKRENVVLPSLSLVKFGAFVPIKDLLSSNSEEMKFDFSAQSFGKSDLCKTRIISLFKNNRRFC
jgi:hypothetical protein